MLILCTYYIYNFLANGNHFFLYFLVTLARDSSFSVQWKCIFQRNPSFRLVEAVLFCLEVFPSSENRHLNYWKPLFKERLYVLNNVTDSLASECHFLGYFQTAVEMEKNDRKCPASVLFSGNADSLFSIQWKIIVQENPYFGPKKTEFRANNGFHKQKKSCKLNNAISDRHKLFISFISF